MSKQLGFVFGFFVFLMTACKIKSVLQKTAAYKLQSFVILWTP